ncbi:MAG: rod shape-determining protein [Clostridiales bacterium]|nr:rod shape-determining protein [Clostridiales bacterium]
MAFKAPDIGIDIGTANTRIYVKKKGILIDEPSILVVDRGGRHTIRAIGEEAKSLLGRTSGDVSAVRPLAEGMIRDFDMTQYMLQYFVRKAIGASRLVKPRAVITIPCRISPIERRAIRKAAVYAGIRENQLQLVEKPFAAALGSGLPVFEPTGSMVVDIGGGTTEAAVISLGGVVVSRSIRIGGIKLDEAIINYVKREFNMLIGDRTAEDVKMTLGAALPLKEERRVLVRGRDMITNLPQTAEISSGRVYEALQAPCQAILAAIQHVLERTPPELAGDVMRSGIHLTGGGAQLFGLDQYIASELDMPVLLAREPMNCAARGVGHLAENIEALHRIGKSSFLREEGEE